MKQFLFILMSLFLLSCGDNKKSDTNAIQEKPILSIAKKHTSFEVIKPISEKEVEGWQELKSVNSFLKKFENVSPNEALSNALELRDLVKNLKDSVKPKIFDIPSFNARVNVLYNETLRLADLTLISAITAEEINKQVDKTIAAFSSVNSKINTILSKKRFEDAIEIDVDFIGIDSTKMDSVSRKTIDTKKQEEFLKKKKLEEAKSKKVKPIKKKKS